MHRMSATPFIIRVLVSMNVDKYIYLGNGSKDSRRATFL